MKCRTSTILTAVLIGVISFMAVCGFAGGQPVRAQEAERFESHGTFSSGYFDEERVFSGDRGYHYTDAYFDAPATVYNQSLATMSLCLSFSAFGVRPFTDFDRYVRKLMAECGFAGDGRYEQYHFNEKPGTDSIGCAIGSKDLACGDGSSTLIAVAVRGAGYFEEWAGNFELGTAGDHAGFETAAEKVKGCVLDYIVTRRIQGPVRIWITGFSRGGAAAASAAAKLDKMAGYTYTEDGVRMRTDFDKSSIYAYSFATPPGAVSSSTPHSADFSNIFNIIEFNDPVPLVPPGVWDFQRYGNTLILPYKESGDLPGYREYYDRLARRLEAGMGYKPGGFRNYRYRKDSRGNRSLPEANPDNHDSEGIVLRKAVNALAKMMRNRARYVEEYQDSFMDLTVKVYADGVGKSLSEMLSTLREKQLARYFTLFPDLGITLINNANSLASVHSDHEYYLGWMQMMDENYPDSLPLMWGESFYRVLEADGAVEMTVFTADEEQIITGSDENGLKTAYLPVGRDYRVEVRALEDTGVTCGVEEYDTGSGKPVGAVGFETMALAAGESVTVCVPAFSRSELEGGAGSGSSAAYTLIRGEETLLPVSDTRTPQKEPVVTEKKNNTITKVTALKKIRYAKLKKRSQAFRITAAVKGRAKKTFKLKSVPKKAKGRITVSSSGKVTVKKGLKKGVYRIRVQVTAKATAVYKKKTVTKTVKIVVR